MKKIDKGFSPVFIVLLFAVLAVVLSYFFLGNKPKNNSTSTNEVAKTETLVTPNPISSDTSFATIESELESTVILDENFSDL